ncbi:hypothetical protein GCK72_016820 [Caenorhabditis remanei]|uniref:Serpentine receptor class r-10 n=1 Tax=Caenorhabditis remanei TaxID=31234 RepID=A0A6A5G646_CAERE|nr:hypothetical protein GCK72_016820 [Caenorhabditis remanei]KAF1750273.1 hypothetical protein GCK72_016820 [Caenorhabditis remanei]
MNGEFWLALADTADMVGFTMTFSVNLVLLGLIRTRGKNLGTYKYLMSFFSFFSMFYSIVESILRPIMHIENTTFFLISRKRFDYSTRLGKINSAFYCACFATSFVLSAVHFVYRYFAACKPHLIRFFNLPYLFLWPIGCSISVTAWASVSYFLYPDTEYTESAVTNVLKTHYDGIKKENVSYIAYVYSMTFVVVFYCGFSTWWTIREHRGASDKTRQLQNQLFKALVLQTLIPSLFMYIPTGVMFVAPFFDVNLNANANFIVFCSFLYPGLDPLILILIIKEFRMCIVAIIKGTGNNRVSDIYTTSRGKMSQVVVHDLSG